MRNILAPLGYVYGEIVKLRREAYSRNLIKSEKLPKPVVSVGNLTVGGTGKTPVVDILLSQIESEGKTACVLTRGYGRKNTNAISVLNANSSTLEGGDEPIWLALRHPKSIVIVGSDRVAAAKLASDVDLFILDDGRQHLQIKRDLEIVLLDCTRPLWNYRPMPWGYAREGLASLKKSDIVILTRVNQAPENFVNQLVKILNELGVKQIYKGRIALKGCKDVWTGEVIDPKKKKLYLISGIGNPESFEKSVSEWDCQIAGHQRKGDHFQYNQKDVDVMATNAKNSGAEIILLTEKDAIKWRELKRPEIANLQIAEVLTSLDINPPLPRIYDLATNTLS